MSFFKEKKNKGDYGRNRQERRTPERFAEDRRH